MINITTSNGIASLDWLNESYKFMADLLALPKVLDRPYHHMPEVLLDKIANYRNYSSKAVGEFTKADFDQAEYRLRSLEQVLSYACKHNLMVTFTRT